MNHQNYRFTNLGNRITLQPPELTQPLGTAGIPPSKTKKTLLVEVDLAKEYPELADSQSSGSWVVALDAREEGQGDPAAAPIVSPVKVVIEFGAGGVLQKVEVDPAQGLVSVPAGYVRVSAEWDPNMLQLPNGGLDGGQQIELRPVTITATLQRSYAAGFATKSFYLFRPNQQVQPNFGRIKIPNFATSYQICGFLDTPQGDAGPLMFWTIEELKNAPGGLNTILDEVANRPQNYQFLLNYCTRNLPPAATDFRYSVEPFANPNVLPFFLTFNLAFR